MKKMFSGARFDVSISKHKDFRKCLQLCVLAQTTQEAEVI